MNIQVITDSTSYISKAVAEELGIRVIPLSFTFGEEYIRETEIDNEDFYKLMEEKGRIPKSSQPPIQDFIDIFSEYVNEGKKVIGIFLSNEMSGTYSTAKMAGNMVSENFKDCQIEIINSKTNCMEMGYSVIKAAEAAREDKPMEEIKAMVKNILCCSRFLFAPSNLTHLRNGGRIGGAQALIGNMFKITPILTVADDGKTDIFDKVRTQKKAIEKIVNHFKKETDQYGVKEVTVHHINELKKAESLVRTIESMIGRKPSLVSIGPIIGLHVGPGTIGLSYTTEREIRKGRMAE